MKFYTSTLTGILLATLLVSCNNDHDKKSSSSSSSSVTSSAASSVSSVSSAESSSSISSVVESSSISSSSSSTDTVVSSSSIQSSVASSASSAPASSSSSSSSSVTNVTLTGTAAIGAAITNGTVTAKCANGTGFTQTVTTNAQGAYSGLVAADSFPCALQITGGTPAVTLHSYAFAAGTINITPFTDLLIANATTQTPATWFQSTNWQIAQNQLQTSQNSLKTVLTNAGYTLPQGTFDPFTTGFQIGDAWDQLLDQLQAAITAQSTTYADLLNLVKDGNLNSVPPKPTNNGSGSGNASACFNPAIMAQGTKVVLNYKITDAQSNTVTNSSSNIEVKGTVTFNGKSATESVSQTTATGAAPSTSTTKSYYTVDTGAKTFTFYGSIVDVTAPVAGSSTLTITPEMVERFDVAAGNSYNQTYSIKTSIQVMGFPVDTTTDFVNQITFKGIESVTVPAGTFQACRIETSSKTTVLGNSTTSVSTSWITVDKGVSVRTESGGDVSELTSGSINGNAI